MGFWTRFWTGVSMLSFLLFGIWILYMVFSHQGRQRTGGGYFLICMAIMLLMFFYGGLCSFNRFFLPPGMRGELSMARDCFTFKRARIFSWFPFIGLMPVLFAFIPSALHALERLFGIKIPHTDLFATDWSPWMDYLALVLVLILVGAFIGLIWSRSASTRETIPVAEEILTYKDDVFRVDDESTGQYMWSDPRSGDFSFSMHTLSATSIFHIAFGYMGELEGDHLLMLDPETHEYVTCTHDVFRFRLTGLRRKEIQHMFEEIIPSRNDMPGVRAHKN